MVHVIDLLLVASAEAIGNALPNRTSRWAAAIVFVILITVIVVLARIP